jgi:hypothetical protein
MKIPDHITFPDELTFDSDIPLLIYRPRGVVNETSMNKAISVLGDLEAALKEPFNRFIDTLGADAVDLNFRYIVHISLYRRLTYAGRPAVKSALLGTNETIVHYAKLHAVLTQGSPINFHIFEKRQDAAEWLGVPIERLELKAPSSGETPTP